jgi:hypothetical protein
MEAMGPGNIRPRSLRLVTGGAQNRAVRETDDEREHRVLKQVAEALREALADLPSTSSWRLPFQKAWRAVRDELQRRRRSG